MGFHESNYQLIQAVIIIPQCGLDVEIHVRVPLKNQICQDFDTLKREEFGHRPVLFHLRHGVL